MSPFFRGAAHPGGDPPPLEPPDDLVARARSPHGTSSVDRDLILAEAAVESLPGVERVMLIGVSPVDVVGIVAADEPEDPRLASRLRLLVGPDRRLHPIVLPARDQVIAFDDRASLEETVLRAYREQGTEAARGVTDTVHYEELAQRVSQLISEGLSALRQAEHGTTPSAGKSTSSG